LLFVRKFAKTAQTNERSLSSSDHSSAVPNGA
jgi:hypothetical protein